MDDLRRARQAIAELRALAGELDRLGRGDGLPWWGPAADQWRRDVLRDGADLRAAADRLARSVIASSDQRPV